MNNLPAIISVDVDGLIAQWDGARFSGDPILVDEANLSVEIGADYLFGNVMVTADAATPLGAAAALASYRPGRTNFTTLPEDVAEILASGHNDPDDME